MAFNVGPGDEVIVPTFTFFATAGTVARVGAKPVFCDVNADTFNAGAAEFERFITPRTKAIMPVHLYGQLTDMKPIMELAGKRGIRVIEDACQAIGAREPGGSGRSAGAIGDYGALSFYPTKNLGAIGDAGAVLTNDPALFELAKKLRIHGSGHTYYHDIVGGNFRIDALQAAILNIKLRKLEAWTEQRRGRARVYTELLHATGLTPEHVRPPQEVYGRHVYHQYVIRAQRRDELAEFLKQRKIGAGVYYPLPLHLQTCFLHLGGKAGDFPQAERAAKEVLALPIYPELTDVQQQTVVGAIREFYRG
jgi:dTDP-4-amino-4,6-dideoxygalactose transaminase